MGRWGRGWERWRRRVSTYLAQLCPSSDSLRKLIPIIAVDGDDTVLRNRGGGRVP